MTSQHIDVLPIIQDWLNANKDKILQFWVGADWRGWARFEIFMALENALKDCLVTHSNDDFWQNSTELMDVVVEPLDGNLGSVALLLRCEKVNDNEGSYERFAEQYNGDWQKLENQGKAQGDFEGTKVLLLGFSGEARGDGIDVFAMDPKPSHFESGDVHGWVKEYQVQT